MYCRFLLTKILRYVVTFFIVLFICFMIPRLMPGDLIQNILGMEYDSLPQEEIDRMYRDFGLDRSLPEQFLDYVKSVFTMNLGYSASTGSLVTDVIMEALVRTLVLMLPAVLIGSSLALIVGVKSGLSDNRITKSMMATAVFVHSTPVFIVGMGAILIFSYYLELLPFGHLTSIGKEFTWDNLPDIIYHLILPVSVLSLFVFTSYFILMRNATRQISSEFFITVNRAHGIGEEALVDAHVSRNVMPQFVGMFAISIGSIISGSMVIETLFSINGMGVQLYKAVMSSDYLLMQGIFLVIILFTLICNFVAELLYGYLDPRIADSGEAKNEE